MPDAPKPKGHIALLYFLNFSGASSAPKSRAGALLQFIYCRGDRYTDPSGNIPMLQIINCIGASIAPKSRAGALFIYCRDA